MNRERARPDSNGRPAGSKFSERENPPHAPPLDARESASFLNSVGARMGSGGLYFGHYSDTQRATDSRGWRACTFDAVGSASR
jgi:hypothetical protein